MGWWSCGKTEKKNFTRSEIRSFWIWVFWVLANLAIDGCEKLDRKLLRQLAAVQETVKFPGYQWTIGRETITTKLHSNVENRERGWKIGGHIGSGIGLAKKVWEKLI
jgi:hypothetical protein